MTIDVLNLVVSEEEKYDLLVFAVGYEKRSRFIAEKFATKSKLVVGFQFPEGHILSFEDNKKFLSNVDGVLMEANETLEAILVKNGEADFYGKKVCLDVSSLNRGAMAAILSELLESEFFSGCSISVLYAVAKFTEPPKEEADFLDFGPLVGFSGWTSSPEKPTALVMGLGYEADHAVGALEYLDPSAAFAFFPIGEDSQFEQAVKNANRTLFEVLAQDRMVQYPVLSPYQTFWQMRSLILTLSSVSRVVLVPMGPKIFCSLCLVCQKAIGDEISVWRASGHTLSAAKDAVAEGPICGYMVKRPEALLTE